MSSLINLIFSAVVCPDQQTGPDGTRPARAFYLVPCKMCTKYHHQWDIWDIRPVWQKFNKVSNTLLHPESQKNCSMNRMQSRLQVRSLLQLGWSALSLVAVFPAVIGYRSLPGPIRIQSAIEIIINLYMFIVKKSVFSKKSLSWDGNGYFNCIGNTKNGNTLIKKV